MNLFQWELEIYYDVREEKYLHQISSYTYTVIFKVKVDITCIYDFTYIYIPLFVIHFVIL